MAQPPTEVSTSTRRLNAPEKGWAGEKGTANDLACADEALACDVIRVHSRVVETIGLCLRVCNIHNIL